MGIVMDVLEQASRMLIYAHPEIRERDALTEVATTMMFYRFLTLCELRGNPAGNLSDSMCEDFETWKKDYLKERENETALPGAISIPGMRNAEPHVEGLWERVEPAVMVVDYISEMTDKFVVRSVFSKDSLQPVLIEHFDREFHDDGRS